MVFVDNINIIGDTADSVNNSKSLGETDLARRPVTSLVCPRLQPGGRSIGPARAVTFIDFA